MTERIPCKCVTPFCAHNKAQVWSCGGGVQSWAIAALIKSGRIGKPDFSVISDTGYETQATWDAFYPILSDELGVERIMASEWNATRYILFHKHGDPVIPIYSTRDSSCPVKLQNHCTGRWKVEAIDKWLRSHGVRRNACVKWIGFSCDEQRRIVSMQQCQEFKRGLIRFPLLEAGLTRRDCIKLVESMGWPTPPRSSCYMCPNHSDHEWRRLIAERPEEFAKAVALEKEIQLKDPDAWLHRSCVPLDQVDFSQPEDLFSRPCDSGMCFV